MLYDEEESSGNDSDTGFEEDMEALRRACSLTGINEPVDDLPTSSTGDGDYEVTDESEVEDLELLRSIQQRFSVPTDDMGTEQKPITMKPLNTILPSGLSDDSGDDYETLCAIQRRFSQYNDEFDNCTESSIQRSEQVGATHNIDLGTESSPNIFVKRVNNGQGFLDSVDGRRSNQNLDNVTSNANASEGHEPGSELVSTTDGGFPRSAQAFVEAINKNRTCQKFIRNKLIQIEAKIEENRKLKERFKILKDFQVACRKRTGRALSQKKDARIQLISVPKQRANASKLKDKSTLPILQGSAENSQVANFRDAMSRYPFSLNREPWSKEEKKNLMKGIKQQFQEVLMQNLFSAGDADSSYLDSMMKQIRDHILTPEEIKLFLPEVNWEHLASMYVTGRSGPECQSRWVNCEDPSINQQPWNIQEDKKLQSLVQRQGFSNWIKVAKELNTNRTPFQCLARFQRSLNVSIIKNEWTRSEDEELRHAVAEYGDTNWQLVASTLEGRTGTQCSNRWKKTLNPLRKRVGKWNKDEDKRLKIAVRFFGAKNWNKLAKFVPGRTQEQCHERWANCLDPSLNMNEWTEDEDLKLKQAIEDHDNIEEDIRALQLDSAAEDSITVPVENGGKLEEPVVPDHSEQAEDSKIVPNTDDGKLEESVVTDDLEEGKEVTPASEHIEEVEGNKKRHLNVVFIGHVDAGKSTIGGQILYLSGQVDERTIQKYEKEAKDKSRESWYMAYIMDTNEEERAKGKTVEVGRAHFETETTRFTILDAPGHKSYVPNMISGASQADIGVLVISARKGEFETGYERGGQTREHVQLAKTLGVSKLLVVVNKMDDPTVNWSKQRYDEIESKMVPFLKSSGYNVKKDIQFLPISGLHGTNLQTRVGKSVCPWWDGQCLFEELDAIEVPLRDPNGPFRMPIIDKFKDLGTVVMGKVESGSVREGNSLLIMPNKVQVKVLAIFIDEDKVRSAGPGENLRVRVSGIEEEDILSGFVLSSVEKPIAAVYEFVAQLHILELLDNAIFTAGYKAILHIHSVVEECEILELIQQIDPKTRKPMKKKVLFVKNGAVVICRIQVTNMICIEKFADFQQLGRFTLRTEGKTVAIGKVTELA